MRRFGNETHGRRICQTCEQTPLAKQGSSRFPLRAVEGIALPNSRLGCCNSRGLLFDRIEADGPVGEDSLGSTDALRATDGIRADRKHGAVHGEVIYMLLPIPLEYLVEELDAGFHGLPVDKGLDVPRLFEDMQSGCDAAFSQEGRHRHRVPDIH